MAPLETGSVSVAAAPRVGVLPDQGLLKDVVLGPVSGGRLRRLRPVLELVHEAHRTRQPSGLLRDPARSTPCSDTEAGPPAVRSASPARTPGIPFSEPERQPGKFLHLTTLLNLDQDPIATVDAQFVGGALDNSSMVVATDPDRSGSQVALHSYGPFATTGDARAWAVAHLTPTAPGPPHPPAKWHQFRRLCDPHPAAPPRQRR